MGGKQRQTISKSFVTPELLYNFIDEHYYQRHNFNPVAG